MVKPMIIESFSQLHQLHKRLVQIMDKDDESETLKDRIDNAFRTHLPEANDHIKSRLKCEMLGLGPIENLMPDAEITEILINGPADIWIEKNGQLEAHADKFISENSYYAFLQRLYQEANIKPDLDRPFADALWKGFRVHVILPPISQKFPCLSLRKQRLNAWSLTKLIELNWCDSEAANLLKSLVHKKQNILIVGATSSGKTSVLNALLSEVQNNERCIAIEDTDEVQLPNPVSTKLLSRVHASEILKDYDLGDLLKQSLRMRPDRIIVGEVRGPEAKDLLMAFATGHQGGMGTLHADSARQALIRLEMLIQLGAPQWSITAIRHLIYLSLSHIAVVRKTNGVRKLDAIVRIASVEEIGFCLETIYSA